MASPLIDEPHTMDALGGASSPQSSLFGRRRILLSAAYVAGMVSKVFEYPFDLTKVRLQSQVLDATARYSGPLDCLKKTVAEEGISGLYRGLPAPVVGAMAENATLFLAYSEFQNLIRSVTHRPHNQELPLQHLALAAAGSGAVTSFVLTPIELVKCKMQARVRFLNVVRTSGVRGLWLGQTGTLIRETGGTAAWFGSKEYVARKLLARRASEDDVGPQRLRLWESALSGASAGAIQTEAELHPGRRPTSFFQMFKAMYKAQGVRGLYTGCGVTIVRSVPSSAIIFLIYDELNKWFG
ncbi:mitochondrial carrier domain-containing protein [Schizophyllum amplum]|uniref:Mitochondrial carrier domain-containing protein n=1 Tax=Schizophyllum amplum TaxID=97359 RepID=A0A550C8A1_9AGAR|nr:mitochondrial carrier domain-containing protein [Auriculariopsis ampla]